MFVSADYIWNCLIRKRFFSYEWLQKKKSRQPWCIVKRERFGDKAVILCEHRDNEPGKQGDYVVFEQLLWWYSIPCDTHFGSRKAAERYYESIRKSNINNCDYSE